MCYISILYIINPIILEMNIHNYHIKHPTQVITTQLGVPQEYRQQCIKEIYRLGDSQDQQTNVKATMTSYLIFDESKVFDKLLDNILTVVNNFIDKPYDLQYILRSAWGTIYKKDDYTIPHEHLPSNLSFVYYLQSSGNTPLVFDNCNFHINPTDDRLAIFPAYLTHSVPKHDDEQDRVCIAGNLIANKVLK